MILIHEKHCPICHHALIEKYDQVDKSLSYFCQFKPRHYFFLKQYYGRDNNQIIRFLIPEFEIVYSPNSNKFKIFKHSGTDLISYIMIIPKLDFEWNNLQKLSNKIKTLITFS